MTQTNCIIDLTPLIIVAFIWFLYKALIEKK